MLLSGLRFLVAWIENKTLVKRLLIPGLATVPVSVSSNILFFEGADAWLKAHPRVAWILFFWPLFAVIAAFIYELLKPIRSLDVNELHTLLRTIANIVGKKIARFAEAAAETQPRRAKELFKHITRPDLQIYEIVSGVYKYFEATKPEDIPEHELNVRVALAEMANDHIANFASFHPADKRPRSPISSLQDARSGFSRAKATRKVIVVESFVEESTSGSEKCFVVTDDSRRAEDGSMICYPIQIRETGEVPYVLSICVAKKRYFKKEEAELYTRILEHFEQRIVLEYHLKRVKARIS